MRVSAILPTYKDSNGKWHEFFIRRMIPSLRHLKGFDLTLLINFQNYLEEDIINIVKKIKKYSIHDIRYSRIDYEQPVSMATIREQIASLDPEADLYLCLDDDVFFGKRTATKFGLILEYFKNTPRCGSCICMGYRGGHRYGDNIVETNKSLWWTNRGLFLRNIAEVPWYFVPNDAMGVIGSCEDAYAVYARLALGYHGAKMYNFATRHKACRVDTVGGFYKHHKGRYDTDFDIHNPKFDGIIRLIREKWSDPTWMNTKETPPKNLIDEYITYGGKDLSQKNIVKTTQVNTLLNI